jgi:hypothetical protein
MSMAKVWVLDTETKGTGAQMVPLDKVERAPSESSPNVVVVREKAPRTVEPREQKPPRFRVVDVMTRQVLADDAGTRETVDSLRDVRSVVDVSVYVWDEDTGDWTPLGIADRKKLLALSRR